LPTLGPVPGFDNLWVAAGHFRAGLQLSAATGLVMAEVLTGRKPTIPLDPFRVARPPQAAVRPAFRS
jgi:glycine oxidase